MAESNEIKVTEKQRLVSTVVGIVAVLLVVILSIFLPNPTPWQQYVFRGCFALGVAALIALIPGFLKVDARLKGWGGYFALFAGGAVAAFPVAYLITPAAIPPNQDVRAQVSIATAASASHITKDILGIWYAEYAYPVKGGTVRMRGTSEYFSNNTYNYVGEMSVSVVNSDSKRIDMTLSIDASNEWSATDTDLTIKAVDIKSHVKTLVIDGRPQPILNTPYAALLSGMESYVPKGTSDHFQITSFDLNNMQLLAKDPDGGTFKIIATRTGGRFARS